MLRFLALTSVTVAIASTLALLLLHRRLVVRRTGKIALALGALTLPALALVTGAGHAYTVSSSTEFCMQCHEMRDYGKSLFIDDRGSMPAVHYQKRLIDREKTCFECHTDYAMFGDVKAKMNGLRHVWVHFLGDVPATFELYAPYPNSNCLHCHEDSRAYLEAGGHRDKFAALAAGELSCLTCHGGHDLGQARQGPYWEVGE